MSDFNCMKYDLNLELWERELYLTNILDIPMPAIKF